LPQLTNFMHGVGVHVDLTNSRFLIYGIILVLTMLFRPEGLIPSRQRRSELRATQDAAQAEQALYSEAVS
jgi:ABC-type branched-subunit amino acid transport system permease subunit